MRILIVEDDKDLCDAVSYRLRADGYDTECCYSGGDMLLYAEENSHDLIILDRMLPGADGLTLLQILRKNRIMVPVIMVTAMNGLNDRVDGLDAGADDYLVKPFAMDELLARVRALLRRPRKLETDSEVTYGPLCLKRNELVLTASLEDGIKQIGLSKREAALMELFMHNHDQILTRDQILQRVWGNETAVEDGNLDNYIYFIRRRLKAAGGNVAIRTVHGVGYRMEKAEN